MALNVKITYDPYRMKTQMFVDGNNILKDENYSRFKEYVSGDLPLQSWIDPIEHNNWKGFLSELYYHDPGESELICEFTGRKLDYEDFKMSLEYQCSKYPVQINLTWKFKETLADIKFAKRVEEAKNMILDEEFKKIIDDPLLNASDVLKNTYTNLEDEYNKAMNNEFRIAFVGVYSSGKSTLINSLIGKELLPMANGTCTSKIYKIYHDPNTPYAAMSCLDANGNEIVSKQEYTAESLNEKLSKLLSSESEENIDPPNNSKIDTVLIYTDLSHLYPQNCDKKFRLVLIDTPGVDSWEGDDTDVASEKHSEITNKIISSRDKEMVIFVSNATKNTEQSVGKFLSSIKDASIDNDTNSYNQRFFFVLNKSDAMECNKNESLSKTLANLEKLYCKGDDNDTINPRFFPVSALLGLEISLGRTKGSTYKSIREKFYTRDDDSDIWLQSEGADKLFFDEYCATSEAIKNEIKTRIQAIKSSDASEPEKIKSEIELHSGVPSLKMAIQDYIERYALPLKIAALLKTFDIIFKETQQLNQVIFNELNAALKAKDSNTSQREAKKNEESAKKDEKIRLENAKKELTEEINKLNELDLTKIVEDKIRRVTVEVDKTIKKVESQTGRKYKNANDAQNAVSSIYTTLVDYYMKNLSDLKSQYVKYLYSVEDHIKTIKEKVQLSFKYNQIFDITKTVEFESIDKSLKDSISASANMVKNPVFNYKGLNLFKHIKKLFAEKEVLDGYTFESEDLSNIIDELHLISAKLDEYKDNLKNKLNDGKNKIINLSEDLKNKLEKTEKQLDSIKNEVNELAKSLDAVEEKIEKINQNRILLLQISEKLEFVANISEV